MGGHGGRASAVGKPQAQLKAGRPAVSGGSRGRHTRGRDSRREGPLLWKKQSTPLRATSYPIRLNPGFRAPPPANSERLRASGLGWPARKGGPAPYVCFLFATVSDADIGHRVRESGAVALSARRISSRPPTSKVPAGLSLGAGLVTCCGARTGQVRRRGLWCALCSECALVHARASVPGPAPGAHIAAGKPRQCGPARRTLPAPDRSGSGARPRAGSRRRPAWPGACQRALDAK